MEAGGAIIASSVHPVAGKVTLKQQWVLKNDAILPLKCYYGQANFSFVCETCDVNT